MQNAVLAVVMSASFIGLLGVALLGRRFRGNHIGLQLGLGFVIGALAALVVLTQRTDLVPDNLEVWLDAALIVVISGVLIASLVYRYR